MQKIILLLFLAAVSLAQLSCKTDNRNSVLVIAVDEMTANLIPCNQEENLKSGFKILCRESVRFSHAFTTSTLSVPALTSLMTGLYPYEHKIHHNGGPGLAPEIETVPELAVKQDYRTGFFSGGAPIFRKSGLNQGFELFDDNIFPTFSSLYRPFKKNADNFIQWLEQEVGHDPFFATIYVPDLLFINSETITKLGETRNLSIESQIDELDENLYDLFESMKKKGSWDNTTIIFVGLNGNIANDRPNERAPLNLHGENTQVALFIKPFQEKKRDEPINWKIDQNVSLADVGKTLFDIVGQRAPDKFSKQSNLPVQSLVYVLKNPNANWAAERTILIESGWAQWHEIGQIRTAFISDHILFINDEKPKLYNSLLDRFEINPLPLLQESILPTTTKIQSIIHENNFLTFAPLEASELAKQRISFSHWLRNDQEEFLLQGLKQLSYQFPKNKDLRNWTGLVALKQKDWLTLKSLGFRNKNSTWQYVADRNLNNKPNDPQNNCFSLLTDITLRSANLKKCNDPLFLELIDWLRADELGLLKETQQKRFFRSFKNYLLDQMLQRYNIAANLIWDTQTKDIFSPSNAELALNLPENSKIRDYLLKASQLEESN